MQMDTNEWVDAALETDSDRFANLINGLPASTSQSAAVKLALGSPLDSRVYALRSVSQDHSVGGNPELATTLARAGIRICELCYEQYGPGTANTFVFGVAQFAIDAHRAYDRMDYHEQQLMVVEQALEWLQDREADERHLTDLRIARIEALVELGRVEQAREGLDAEVSAGNSNHPSFGLLDQQISARLVSATETKDQRSVEEQLAYQRQQSLKAALQGFSSLTPEFSDVLDNLSTQVDERREVLSATDSIARDSRMYQQLGQFMESMAGGSGKQINLNISIQQSSAILADPKLGYDTDSLDKVMQSLETVRHKATDAGLRDTATDTLWPLYICYKRLEQFDTAFNTLQTIRSWVSERRAIIQDPLKRAGISKQYPHLYQELSARLFERGDSAELLSAIEESKGRALADKLALEAHQEGLLKPSDTVAAWLPGLMSGLDAHYISFLTNEDVSYAVCVSKGGELHSACPAIGNKCIDNLRNDIDPSNWGKKTTGFFASPNDVAQQLSPLINWLGELVDSEVLKEGDHICYSPDGLLHLVPLHYVDFRGVPLVKYFSLSRTHSATLLHYCSQKPPSTPTHYIAVQVPLADEVLNNPDKVTELARVADWLNHGPLPGSRLDKEIADFDTLAAQNCQSSVLHFATHGYFPRPEEANNPFHRSGLLLSENGKLPHTAKQGGLLTPERIMAQNSPLSLTDSHVSLQACVSGLSEEGVGGDALGLEWSLLMAGANSVLSTHWNIPVHSSADFCIRFYQEWLAKKQSRAQAWRRAVLSLLNEDNAFEGRFVYHWAPFSLAGDWR